MSFLQCRYPKTEIENHLTPLAAWRPVPGIADRPAWEGLRENELNRRRCQTIIAGCENLLSQPWPLLTASHYREYLRSGDRSRHSAVYMPRRHRLGEMALGECIENRGRFLDDIVDGIWLLCEETSWALPAHSSHTERGELMPLPDPEDPAVALFSCQTAALLAEVAYLLAPRLDEISPLLRRRIHNEIERRILIPFETRERMRWPNNNWQPWCCSNLITAAMYLVEDNARLANLVYKTMGVVDAYLGSYSPDGGCDEGPSYWSISVGSMVKYLEHLYERTNGYIDIYAEPVLKKMGEYFFDVLLFGQHVFNYGDCAARCDAQRATVWRLGERTGSRIMHDTICYRFGLLPEDKPLYDMGTAGALYQKIRELFWIPANELVRDAPVSRPLLSYYDELELMFARQNSTLDTGWVVAAKGGHNDVSHNHNDVGHFVLAVDRDMVVIDLGNENYTKQTFSDKRYELWTIRGSAHNAPLVNGYEQQAGAEYRATGTACTELPNGCRLEMELSSIYPVAAGVQSLRRTLTFAREPIPQLTVTDDFQLAEGSAELLVNLYTPGSAAELAPGRWRLTCGETRVRLTTNPDEMKIAAVIVPLSDPGLRRVWGETVTRLELCYRTEKADGSYTLTFTPENGDQA